MKHLKLIIPILFLFLTNQMDAQNGLNLRLENSFEYFSNNESDKRLIHNFGNDQLLYNIKGKLALNLDDLIVGIGIGYHRRLINDLCIYWPSPTDTFLVIAPGPFYNTGLPCNRTVEGKISFIETPVFIGYQLFQNSKMKLTGELIWAPFIQFYSYHSYKAADPIDSQVIERLRRGRANLANHGIAINLLKKLNAKWNLIAGINFKSDDFSYKRVRSGLMVGVAYQMIDFAE